MDNAQSQLLPVYCDQNIWASILQGNLDDLLTHLKSIDGCVFVYSEATINEIARDMNLERRKAYIDLLAKLNARYMVIQDDNSVQLLQCNPEEPLSNALNDKLSQTAMNTMQQFLFKFHGGRKGEDFKEVLHEQVKMMENLFSSLSSNIDTLQNDPTLSQNDLELLRDAREKIKAGPQAFANMINDLGESLDRSIPNQKDFNGLKDIYTEIDCGPIILNNIKPPNVVDKIWDRFKNVLPAEKQLMTIDDYLSQHLTSKSHLLFNKVNALYSFLNSIGYHSDKATYKENKFVASMTDHRHCGYGAFCAFVFSSDNRFIMKSSAVYEYFKINSQLMHVE